MRSSQKGHASLAAMKLGFVNDGFDHYLSPRPFINEIRNTRQTWGGTGAGSVDVNGWITNMPNGQSVSLIVMHGQDYPVDYIRSGRYVCTWSGPLTVDITSGSGAVSNKVTTDHRIEFDLAALSSGNSGGNFLNVIVSNSSGSAGSVSDIAVYHSEDEALYLAGEIFGTAYLDSLHGADVVRFLGWMGTNSSGVVNYSDFKTEAHCLWYPIPISVMAKLGAKLNKDVWICVPHQATQACMNAVAAELWNQLSAYPNVKIYGEYSNETWNSIFTQSGYVTNTKSVGLTIVDNNGNPSTDSVDKAACATAHGAMQVWTALETYFPRNRVARVYAGQAANWGARDSGFEYADTSLALYSGEKLKNLVDAYAIAPYFRPTVGGSYGVPADMTKKSVIARSDHAKSDSYWDRVVSNSLATTVTDLATSKAGCTGKRADIQLISYELGHEFQLSLNDYTQNWTASVVANELDFGTDITGIFTNGDLISVAFQTDNGTYSGQLFSGASFWRGFLCRIGTTNNKLKAYANQADYDSNTPATLNTSATTGGAGDGLWHIDNWTRCNALAQKYRDMLDSHIGVRWYRKYYDICKAGGLSLFLHLGCAGMYVISDGSFSWFQWGLKRSPYDPDSAYPRAAWFRRFANGT